MDDPVLSHVIAPGPGNSMYRSQAYNVSINVRMLDKCQSVFIPVCWSRPDNPALTVLTPAHTIQGSLHGSRRSQCKDASVSQYGRLGGP